MLLGSNLNSTIKSILSDFFNDTLVFWQEIVFLYKFMFTCNVKQLQYYCHHPEQSCIKQDKFSQNQQKDTIYYRHQ